MQVARIVQVISQFDFFESQRSSSWDPIVVSLSLFSCGVSFVSRAAVHHSNTTREKRATDRESRKTQPDQKLGDNRHERIKHDGTGNSDDGSDSRDLRSE